MDANKITAEFEKGVLKVHMPKTAEAQAKTRKIEIDLTIQNEAKETRVVGTATVKLR